MLEFTNAHSIVELELHCSFFDYCHGLIFYIISTTSALCSISIAHWTPQIKAHLSLHQYTQENLRKNTFHSCIFVHSVTSWQCGFCHQTPVVFSSAPFWYQTVGTLLGRIWSMSLSFVVNRKVSELEKCDAGFSMCQESAEIKILYSSLECRLKKV